MENFGTRLKQTMEGKGISASELSRASGVGKNLISYYIHGRCLAKQDKVFLLAKALNVNPGWLMTGVEQISDTDQCDRQPIVIQNIQQFSHLLQYMTEDEYNTVVAAFEAARQRMKEKGKEP